MAFLYPVVSKNGGKCRTSYTEIQYKNEDWIKDNIDHCTNNGGEHTDLCKSLCCNERVHSHNDQYKNTSKDVDAGIGNGIRKCLTTCTEKGQHLWGKNKENKGQYNCHDNKKRKAVPKDLFCSPVILFPHGNRGTRSTSRTGKHGKCIDQH